MNYFLLILNIIIIIKFLKRFEYLSYIYLLLKLINKSTTLIKKRNISDHWKEKIIPKYSFLMIKYSLKMLIIFGLCFSTIILSSILFNDFLKFLFTFKGIMTATLFGYFYIYINKLLKN